MRRISYAVFHTAYEIRLFTFHAQHTCTIQAKIVFLFHTGESPNSPISRCEESRANGMSVSRTTPSSADNAFVVPPLGGGVRNLRHGLHLIRRRLKAELQTRFLKGRSISHVWNLRRRHSGPPEPPRGRITV